MLTPRSTSDRAWRALRRLSTARSLVASAMLLALTGYLLLERNHAEELGGGFRAGLDIARGERALSPVTWVALVLSGYLLVHASRLRQRA